MSFVDPAGSNAYRPRSREPPLCWGRRLCPLGQYFSRLLERQTSASLPPRARIGEPSLSPANGISRDSRRGHDPGRGPLWPARRWGSATELKQLPC
jgi:hypothetical protein